MARAGQRQGIGKGIAGVLIAGMLGAGALAEEAAQPAPSAEPSPPAAQGSPMLAPYSPECQGGTTEIVTQSPLPHVTAALQNRKTIRILAIGATGGRRQGGYTAQIERLLKQAIKGIDVVIVNRGVSGELAADAAHRIRNEVALTDPDLVIWQVGTNDALTFVPLDEFEQTVKHTVKWLKEHDVDVVLAGLQYVARVSQDEHYYRVRELLREIAARENIMLIRRYEATQFIASMQEAGGEGFVPDEFERTGNGYNCLSQYLASAITLGAFGKGISGRPFRSPDKQPPEQQQQGQPQ
jgi:acyl-CoA thioesterase I